MFPIIIQMYWKLKLPTCRETHHSPNQFWSLQVKNVKRIIIQTHCWPSRFSRINNQPTQRVQRIQSSISSTRCLCPWWLLSARVCKILSIIKAESFHSVKISHPWLTTWKSNKKLNLSQGRKIVSIKITIRILTCKLLMSSLYRRARRLAALDSIQ